MPQPPRIAWRDFPDTVVLAAERRTKQHPEYLAAKSGDPAAATRLVDALVDETGMIAVRRLLDAAVAAPAPALVSAHAYEREGVNAIPIALARLLSDRLGLECEDTVVQTNVVSHTGAGGYARLARQAAFTGEVAKGRHYVMIDDFIGQGGTLANLRGWVEQQGCKVIGAVVLAARRTRPG